jgi:hypothetical protein
MLKYIKRGLIVCMLALVFLVLAYLLGVKTYDAPKKEKTQVYETDSTILRTTKTDRLARFKSTLEKVQQFGGGEVIFEGGKGFVLFRVRKDGSLVAKVPVFASIPHISSTTLFRLILLSKRYYTIRLASWEREQLEQMAPFQDAPEREVPYPKTDPHIFLEADLGTDISAAAELTEAVLTKVFHVKRGMLTIYAGDYREFRSSAPLGP